MFSILGMQIISLSRLQRFPSCLFHLVNMSIALFVLPVCFGTLRLGVLLSSMGLFLALGNGCLFAFAGKTNQFITMVLINDACIVPGNIG